MIDPIGDGANYHKTSACYVHRDLILQMWNNGESVTKIAKAVQTHRRHVRNFLKRNVDYKPRPTIHYGEECGSWKGGVSMSRGYVRVRYPDHPHARNGYVLEHRLVMEKMIGRYLDPKEVVHHKDGNKSNNDPSNLQLFSENALHLAHELKGRCPQWSEAGKASLRKVLEKNTSPENIARMRQGYRRFADARRERIQKEIEAGVRGLRLTPYQKKGRSRTSPRNP